MKTVTVTSSEPKDIVSCVAFLDEGSDVTLVTTEIARKIGCTGKPQKLRIQTVNGISEHTAEKVSFEVQGSSFPQEEPKKHKLQDAYAVSTLPLWPQMVSEEQVFERYPECKQYTHCLPTLGKKATSLDWFRQCRSDRRPEFHFSYQERTIFTVYRTQMDHHRKRFFFFFTGNVIVSNSSVPICKPIDRLEIVSDQSFLELVKDTWSTESFGCKYDLSEVKSFEDRKVEAILDKQVLYNGQRWYLVPSYAGSY